MKPQITIAIAACAGLAAFFLGRMHSVAGGVEDAGRGKEISAGKGAPHRERGTLVEAGRRKPVKERVTSRVPSVTAEEAAGLTRAEKLERIGLGALVFNNGNQMAAQLAVIATLTKEEIAEAVGLVGAAQDKGNGQTQEIWDALWKQWGKVDAEGCLAGMRENPKGKGREDMRNVMRGWLEADPAAALAWARQPDHAPQEAAAVAMAISHSTGGDPEKMRAEVEALPAGKVRQEAMRDLYDMEGASGGGRGPAEVYADLSPALKADGWNVTMQRLYYVDSGAAGAWLKEHAGEPGTDYGGTRALVAEMTQGNPKETAAWAASLPDVSMAQMREGNRHPLVSSVHAWAQMDAPAAKAWLDGLPGKPEWAAHLSGAIDQNFGKYELPE